MYPGESVWRSVPAQSLVPLSKQNVGWKISSEERQQDDFKCAANQWCAILDLTSDCHMYTCVRCYKGRNVTLITPNCTLMLNATVNMCHWNITARECESSNGTRWNITTGDEDIWISNGTVIQNRTRMLWLILVRPNVSDAHRTQLAPIMSTCQQMAQAVLHTDVHWQVRLPAIPECQHKRRRRAWYDTLLGGAGTVMGISNAIDSEVTRTKLSNTGQATSRGLHTIGRWVPSVMMTQGETAEIMIRSLQWELDVWGATQELFGNITAQLNWTACHIQMLHAQIQKERFLRVVTSPNVQAWRGLWNVSEKLWMITHPERTWCNATMCNGYFVTMNVTHTVTVCRYYVLPVITSSGYYFLKTRGQWFSPDTNIAYDLSACEQTDQGKTCLLMDRYRDPCLTKGTALCEWTVETPRDMMWQIGPHTLCVATNNPHPMLPSAPFSGCLSNVYQWHWQNQTYLLNPWDISLDRFKRALDRSEVLKQILRKHQTNVTKVTVSTFIHGQEVVHAARVVDVESAHHWWDILSGMSSTAGTFLFPPLSILVAVLVILTCCNVLTCLYIWRVRRRLLERIHMGIM
ncbi:uncharacterized protein LOC122540961 [Chiloscyllium plagiosum]|uniref:uncharacterized protein LOC122540961 n=1 Tax=Chiloscyllium plagiosum TaxID=36176 RepID=UPI001CB7D31F|nr:uncharacterized protein LOC122540961 [Chiloscyllium plagiosum]